MIFTLCKYACFLPQLRTNYLWLRETAIGRVVAFFPSIGISTYYVAAPFSLPQALFSPIRKAHLGD